MNSGTVVQASLNCPRTGWSWAPLCCLTVKNNENSSVKEVPVVKATALHTTGTETVFGMVKILSEFTKETICFGGGCKRKTNKQKEHVCSCYFYLSKFMLKHVNCCRLMSLSFC